MSTRLTVPRIDDRGLDLARPGEQNVGHGEGLARQGRAGARLKEGRRRDADLPEAVEDPRPGDRSAAWILNSSRTWPRKSSPIEPPTDLFPMSPGS